MNVKIIKGIKYYSPLEEKINVYSHGLGAILSVVALVLLVNKASTYGNIWHIVSFSIFGASLLILYSASTLYHSTQKIELRRRLKVFDHAAIYVLIAGTYTPFTLVSMQGQTGWIFFGISWGIALIGITLKLFFTGRFTLISTAAYVLMGWIIVFAIKPIRQTVPIEGLYWLMGGGLAYTIGAILYAIKSIKFNHALFHILVLVGSFCHFISVYYYVLLV